MSAAELKTQIGIILDDLADTVNELQNVNGKLNDVEGGVILLGLTSSNNKEVAGTVAMTNAAKQLNDSLLEYVFSLRQRLTIYRDTVL